MTIFLGLGSNEGDRHAHLQQAVEQLQVNGFEIAAISPMVETPALLPKNAPPSWSKPFLNCVISGQANWQPRQGLKIAKKIELGLGRQPTQQTQKWAPRTIDIDLLIWHDQIVDSEELTLPHYAITERAFVLTPLLHLQPDLVIPGQQKTVFDWCKVIKPSPLWMGILNITPDSFSDGGRWDDEVALSERIEEMSAENVQIIDIGAESTRPNAMALNPEQEWQRLQPVLQLLSQRFRNQAIRPLLCVDSRHASTLEKILQHGVDMVNDVTGLRDPAMMQIARESGCQVVAMHSMSIPANPDILLPTNDTAVNQLRHWLNKSIDRWLDNGLNLNKIVFDPGIGFGKSSLQSLELLQQCNELKESGLRLLIGHSRKSFMNGFTNRPFNERDIETVGISLSLCHQGVDIIRVHDPIMHIRAYRGWSHTAK